MAFRFGDSFDHYATAALTANYTSVYGATVVSGGRNGGSRIRLAGAIDYAAKSFDNQPTWVVGAAFQCAAIVDGSVIFQLRDATTTQVDLRLKAGGELQITRNGAQLAISSGLGLQTYTWYYVELRATIDNSGSYEVRINGASIPALTGTGDTQATANAYASTVQLCGASGGYVYYDDLYICDGSGVRNNDFLGDRRSVAILPDGPGNYSQWTPSAGSNYQNVDDSTPDGDATYNETSTAGAKDSYAYGAVGVAGSVAAVQVSFDTRKTDAGTRTVRPFVRIGSTDYFGSNVNLSDSFTILTYVWETNPATGAAWTVSEIDAAEFGIELVA